MRRIFLILIAVLTLTVLYKHAAAQSTDNTMKVCSKYIIPPYISDGQQYRALLNGDEVAEFHATFYGGSTYRIAVCCGESEGALIFSLYDNEHHLLFTNKDFENAPYWDFKFKASVDCIIEAQLDLKTKSSGLAVMLIGFKQ